MNGWINAWKDWYIAADKAVGDKVTADGAAEGEAAEAADDAGGERGESEEREIEGEGGRHSPEDYSEKEHLEKNLPVSRKTWGQR